MATKDVTDLQVCLAVAQYQREHGKWPYEILAQWTGQCEKVCFCSIERAERNGLIEYGVSLRSGWLTEEGLNLVKEANASLERQEPRQ